MNAAGDAFVDGISTRGQALEAASFESISRRWLGLPEWKGEAEILKMISAPRTTRLLTGSRG